MSKLDKIYEFLLKDFEDSVDGVGCFEEGIEKTLALNLPVKFAEWTQKDKWHKYANGKWGAVRAGYGGGEQALYTDQELFDYWLENICKPE